MPRQYIHSYAIINCIDSSTWNKLLRMQIVLFDIIRIILLQTSKNSGHIVVIIIWKILCTSCIHLKQTILVRNIYDLEGT